MENNRILKFHFPDKYGKMKEFCDSYLISSDIKCIEILLSEVHFWAKAQASEFVTKQHYHLTENETTAIKDTDTLITFTDYQNGYVGQMNRWMKENSLEIKADYVSSRQGNPLPLNERESVKRPLVCITGGAVLAGFLAFCKVKYLWLLEIIPAIATIVSYNQGRKMDEPKIKQLHLSHDKQHYCELCQELTDYWFAQMEKKSEEILLNQFNIR